MEAGETINRLVMVMVADDQAKALGRLLVKQGFRFTLVQAGGLMQTGTVCLLLGIDLCPIRPVEGPGCQSLQTPPAVHSLTGPVCPS